MRRTQIYLEDEQVAKLRSAARIDQRTVSEIIREAIDDKLSRPSEATNFDRALEAATGVWSDRDDLGTTDEYVRGIREDRRGSSYR